MKRFIRKKLRRWLGITKLFNDIRVLNHLIKSLDDKQVRLEQAFYETIDEDVSAEVQALIKEKDNK